MGVDGGFSFGGGWDRDTRIFWEVGREVRVGWDGMVCLFGWGVGRGFTCGFVGGVGAGLLFFLVR